MVTWADHTQFPRPTLEETLTMARDAVVGSKKVLKDDVIKVAGNPGREFAFVEADGNAVHVQAFIVGKRVYQLGTSAKAENYSLQVDDREHFLKSFQLAE